MGSDQEEPGEVREGGKEGLSKVEMVTACSARVIGCCSFCFNCC